MIHFFDIEWPMSLTNGKNLRKGRFKTDNPDTIRLLSRAKGVVDITEKVLSEARELLTSAPELIKELTGEIVSAGDEALKKELAALQEKLEDQVNVSSALNKRIDELEPKARMLATKEMEVKVIGNKLRDAEAQIEEMGKKIEVLEKENQNLKALTSSVVPEEGAVAIEEPTAEEKPKRRRRSRKKEEATQEA